MKTIYRKGPIGALYDEYLRAVEELKSVIAGIDTPSFVKIIDHETKDRDCKSVQTILNHVVRAGYGYANYIRKQFGDGYTERKENYELHSPKIACEEMDKMMKYTLETLENKWDISFDEVLRNEMKVSWGQVYDFEQLLEHAIVHILRHRRQIEKLLIT